MNVNGNVGFLGRFKSTYESRKMEHISFIEFLDRCKADPLTYDSAHGRLLRAVGDPNIVDTQKDERLGRIFDNRIIKMYPTFADFYGIEHVVEEIVSFFDRGQKGGEAAKQIIYLLGPVGGGKSSLAERIKELFQKIPFYALTDKSGKISPIFESPLGIFCEAEQRAMLEKEFKINPRFVPTMRSRWVQKRLDEYGGDFTQFQVVKLYPSIIDQIGIAQTSPADENTQDVSVLVGKTDIRVLDVLPQSDPDAYVYSGTLCASTQGIFDFVEMFKAPIKMLNPLLTSTQEHRYEGSERIGSLPYHGLVLAHSNEGEWQTFRSKKENEALVSRTTLIRVPYCLRTTEEKAIYKKKLDASAYKDAPCAPGTYELMAQLAVMSRLEPFADTPILLKMKVYDGESLQGKVADSSYSPIQEYREKAGVNEGMKGIHTRFAFQALERTYEYSVEVSANPVTLLRVLKDQIKKEDLQKDVQEKYLGFLKDPIEPELAKFIEDEFRDVYFQTQGGEIAQTLFERYFWMADCWLEKRDFPDRNTGLTLNRAAIDSELSVIEKRANITNAKDFRVEVVHWILHRKDGTKMPDRKTLPKLNEVIEKTAFPSIDALWPILGKGGDGSDEEKKTFNAFYAKMKERGYTPAMIRLLGDWCQRRKSSS